MQECIWNVCVLQTFSHMNKNRGFLRHRCDKLQFYGSTYSNWVINLLGVLLLDALPLGHLTNHCLVS
jgi:hypothetical protein